jgi:hypothetical protein
VKFRGQAPGFEAVEAVFVELKLLAEVRLQIFKLDELDTSLLNKNGLNIRPRTTSTLSPGWIRF